MPEPEVVEQNRDPLQVIEARAVSRIKAKILHVLSIYPKLNHSMLQVGIGPSIAPDIWRPVLQALIAAGWVSYREVETTGPTGRSQNAGILSLTEIGLELTQLPSQARPNNNAQVNGEAAQAVPDSAAEVHRA